MEHSREKGRRLQGAPAGGVAKSIDDWRALHVEIFALEGNKYVTVKNFLPCVSLLTGSEVIVPAFTINDF